MKRVIIPLLLAATLIIGCSKEALKFFNYGNVELCIQNNADLTSSDVGVYVNEVVKYPYTGEFEIPIIYNMQFLFEKGAMKGDNLYLDRNKRFNINAYAPYIHTGDSKSHYLPFNHGTDILWAQSSFPALSQESLNLVNLEFKHLTTQVLFELEDMRDSTSKSKYDFEGANYSIRGFSKRSYLNVTTGEMLRGEVDSSVIISNKDGATCFVPAEGTSQYNIELTIPSKVEDDTTSQVIKSNFSYHFYPAHSYTLTIKVYTTEIVISVNVAEWVVNQSDKLEL